MPTRFLIRFDDITPGMAWTKFAPFERVADELDIPFLIGVVPECRDPSLTVEPERADFWHWLRGRAAKGWTIAQHGYTHIYATSESGLLGIGSKSEFAGLPYSEQFQKLAAGKDILVREGLWHGVFMAPSHAFDTNTLKALKALDFKAVTDGYGFYAYDLEGLVALPQLLSKPLGLGFGIETICLHANTMSEAAIERMVDFITLHKSQVIGFGEAIAIAPPSEGLDRLTRFASQWALRVYRLVRG
jgi:predicted deacetylase